MVKRALYRKLWGDLWRMRGQVLAIGLIMASGIGVLIMGLATVESLDETARALNGSYFTRTNEYRKAFESSSAILKRRKGSVAIYDGICFGMMTAALRSLPSRSLNA